MMSSRFNLRVLASTVACASVAFVGMISPAFAQDRTIWLRDNETTTITGYFLQGEDVYASCDQDCMDLDLFLYNEMGVLVDSDEAVDSFPIVTAPYEGTFSVQVSMPSCTHAAGCGATVSSDFGF
ncbi:MAG: hypothetical protein AAFP20_05075 [Cyanobacteria bacterium J06614_10]